jgi:hypothetical protein
MRWARHIARMGEGTGVCKVSVGKPEIKIHLVRPWCRWEDNINLPAEPCFVIGLPRL